MRFLTLDRRPVDSEDAEPLSELEPRDNSDESRFERFLSGCMIAKKRREARRGWDTTNIYLAGEKNGDEAAMRGKKWAVVWRRVEVENIGKGPLGETRRMYMAER